MLLTTTFCFQAHAHAEVRDKSPLPAFPAIIDPSGTLVSHPCSSPLSLMCEYKELGLSKSSHPLISFPENYHLSASWELILCGLFRCPSPAVESRCLSPFLFLCQIILAKATLRERGLLGLQLQAPVQQWRQVTVTGLETAGRSHCQEQRENLVICMPILNSLSPLLHSQK